jgi:hypothetical protein
MEDEEHMMMKKGMVAEFLTCGMAREKSRSS